MYVWYGIAATEGRPQTQHNHTHTSTARGETKKTRLVESSWLRSFGLVWFVRGLARVGLTYVGLFGCVGIVFHFR